ncbi:MAG: DUF5667 domain-containing protein [Candidatus Doudnabacteria bacterium]|nr:DUF5667 domain-containing protein [bacterium]MDZ4243587.1 DUF5667 domain-containing protein [Candidatus Doudnabacteria bacterium]
MTDNFEKIFGEARKTSLPKDEKEQIRSRLLAFIQAHPVREGYPIRHLWQRSRIFLSLKNLKPMPIIIAIFILLGGSVSASAENSLPGDLLYPVKISVNEKVVSAFKLSSDAKANWEVRIAERRLEEAEHIAIGTDVNVSGDMRSQAIANIRENFEKQESRIQDRIAKLEAEGNTQAAASLSSKLEVSLETHAAILNRLEQKLEGTANNEGIKPALRELRLKIEARGEATAKTRGELEAKVSAAPDVMAAAFGAATASANKIEEVTKFIAQATIRLGADAVIEAEAKLEAANQVRSEAQAKFDTGAYGEAFVLFHESARAAQEAKLLAGANFKLEIESNEDASASINEEIEGNANQGLDLKLELGR